MQRPMAEGWKELVHGHLGEANRIFTAALNAGTAPHEALLGLARVAYQQGDLEKAQELTLQGLAHQTTLELTLMLAQVQGDMGKRREAEKALDGVLRANPNHAFARALLAEQVVRQGRWEEGTEHFVRAMSNDPTGEAFEHFQRVVSNLVDAFNAGRMPEKTAIQFINRVDYSIPKANPEVGFFFGAARRAITARQPLSAEKPRPRVPDNVQPAARAPESAPRAPANQYTPSFGPGAQSPAQPPTPERNERRARAAQASPQPSTPAPRQANSAQKDMQALIQHDRQLNQDLLQGIAELEPARWPSEPGYTKIDTVEPIHLSRSSLAGVSTDIDVRDFRVTTGSLSAEIYLERCVRSLLVATQKQKAGALVARPDSVWQMELNGRDGLLQQVAPPAEFYREFGDFEKYAELSLGKFLGNILAVSHGAVWTYENPASQSYLEVGDTVLRPFELVERWVQAKDKDDVDLQVLMRTADLALQRSTSITIQQDYVDPTADLTAEATGSVLATLWSAYRFSLPETSFSDIADDIELREWDETTIVFTLPTKWAPQYAQGVDGILDGGRVALAYLRDSGEFVALASRKGFAGYLEQSAGSRGPNAARHAIETLAKYHCPAARIATGKTSSARLSKQLGLQIPPPQVSSHRGRTQLLLSGVDRDNSAKQWRLRYDNQALIPWTLDYQH